MISAVIFDMDGLMLDSEPLYKFMWQQAAADLGYHMSDELYAKLIGRNIANASKIAADEFGPAFPLEVFRERCKASQPEIYRQSIPKKPGLDALLDFLDSRAIPKAIATSTPRESTLSQLNMTGLLPRFKAVTAGDEVANGKPAPDLFLLAADRIGVNPSACLALEDSEYGIVGADRAGMTAFWVRDLQPLSPEVERLAKGKFNSLREVQERLESMFAGRTAGSA